METKPKCGLQLSLFNCWQMWASGAVFVKPLVTPEGALWSLKYCFNLQDQNSENTKKCGSEAGPLQPSVLELEL